MALAEDGSVAAVPTADGLALLAGADGRVLREERIMPVALALSADGRLFARNGAKDGIEVMRVSDGEVVARFDSSEVGSLRRSAWSARGE